MKNVYFIENKIQCDYSEFSYVIEKKKNPLAKTKFYLLHV